MGEVTDVLIFPHEPGINQGCKKCRTVYVSGHKYALGLRVKEGDNTHDYLIGVDPPVSCCGEQKAFFQSFVSNEEAQAAAEMVQAQINRDGSTKNLRLVDWAIPSSN